MIATLNGRLKLRDPGRLIVETAGVGTTTTAAARIFHSTRIARILARLCYPGSEESLPSRALIAFSATSRTQGSVRGRNR